MGKKKKKEKRLKKTTKRLPKRIRKKKSPFNIIVKNWGVEPFDPDYKKEIQLNENSTLEIHIDKEVYQVSINKKNRCLQFNTHETHLYLQPISVHQFLIKANSKIKENEGNSNTN